MNINQLNQLAKQFAKEYWNLEFNLPIKLNHRLKMSRARFLVNRGTRVMWIEFQPSVLQYDSEANIISTLKHELCHWACYLKNPLWYKDGHPYFEKELVRIGSHSTGTFTAVGERYFCKCSGCGKELGPYSSEAVARRRETKEYFTRCCGTRVTYVGKKVISRSGVASEKVMIPEPCETTLPASGSLTAAELAAKLGMDGKTLRRKLRNAGFQKTGSEWSFSPQMVEEIKKKLGR